MTIGSIGKRQHYHIGNIQQEQILYNMPQFLKLEMGMTMKNKILFTALLMCSFMGRAESLAVKMLPGEKWWGVCNSFGREMPFSEKSDFACDLRLNNYSHQSL